MSTIVAICPYCRVGGVRAPVSAVGASATCPKCKSNFTVLPSDVPPGWDKPAAPKPTATPPAAVSGVTEPPPAAPSTEAELQPKVELTSAELTPNLDADTSSGEAAEAPEPVKATDFGLVIALGALILVGPAVLASQVSYGRFVTAGLALVGLVGGLAALAAEGKARWAGAGAGALHFVIFTAACFLPLWLNPTAQRDRVAELPQTVLAVPLDGGYPEPAEWVDTGKACWEYRGVRVAPTSVAVKPTDPPVPGQRPRNFTLHIRVGVSNFGSGREVEFRGWGDGPTGPRLTDSAGKALATKAPGAGQPRLERPGLIRLEPMQSAGQLFLFEPPPRKVDLLRLELPGKAVDCPEPVRLLIPGSAITGLSP